MRLIREWRWGKRAAELEGFMNNLMRNHPNPQAVDEWFPYITLYAGSISREEDQFCRGYLMKRARDGYRVYDEERLK